MSGARCRSLPGCGGGAAVTTSARLGAGAIVLAVIALPAATALCDPLVARPLSSAPTNTCPCDGYDPGSSTAAARCRSSDLEQPRCEIPGQPNYPFWLVVNVPDTSIFAPG